MTHETHIEIPVTVEYTYYPPCRGHRDRYGAPEEPDEPASVEIGSVLDAKGNELWYSLDEKQLKSIEDEIWEALRDRERECEPPEPPDDVT